MSETYKFLQDEEELKWFWQYAMPPLKQHEAYFISTSARNKQLDEQEREIYQVGRSEMWHKEIIPESDYNRFIKGIRRCECNKYAYLTKANLPYPDKVLVLYINIVPTNAYRAMQEQLKYLIDIQQQLTDAVVKNSEGGIEACYKNIRHCHTTGQSVFARCFSDTYWVDIDCDCESTPLDIGIIKEKLFNQGFAKGDFIIVDTAGGTHWMFTSTSLKGYGKRIKNDPIKMVVNIIESVLRWQGYDPKEVVRNKNEMIPLPGTLQYGDYLVRVINKQDFDESMKLQEI
jgi:hypothetical protein